MVYYFRFSVFLLILFSNPCFSFGQTAFNRGNYAYTVNGEGAFGVSNITYQETIFDNNGDSLYIFTHPRINFFPTNADTRLLDIFQNGRI